MIRPVLRVEVKQNRIPGLSKRLQSLAGRNSEQTAKGIVGSAQSRAPVDTGFLRGSIEAIKTGPYTWSVIVGAPYAKFVEYGTVHMSARPYFTPAVLEWESKFLANLDRALDEL